MRQDLEKLNNELYEMAFIKYVDINSYPAILRNLNLENIRVPTQILINSDGLPYQTDKSEVLGYKTVKDNEGNLIYTLHDGDLSYGELKMILQELGLKSKEK